jgi:hypothetical protein
MTITEPTTMMTDYILGLVSLILGLRLIIFGMKQKNKLVLYWGIAFGATAIAAFIGGTYHGFLNYLGLREEFILWKLTMFFAGVMSLTMITGSLYSIANQSILRLFLGAAVLKFVVFLFFMLMSNNFSVVVLDYIPAMIGVFVCHLIGGLKSNSRGHFWIIIGVLISFLSAWLQQRHIMLHQNFNHNDLYHVLQTLAMTVFYKGLTKI